MKNASAYFAALIACVIALILTSYGASLAGSTVGEVVYFTGVFILGCVPGIAQSNL